ncbi:flavin-containing monooxygenase [Spirillospora sp. CA-128828]|uniref:flavin-containing monooxygenase n=1 Tax=Spirillospora sp. CA-128828 TaxID=3240033 RepID=UPI003D8B3654
MPRSTATATSQEGTSKSLVTYLCGRPGGSPALARRPQTSPRLGRWVSRDDYVAYLEAFAAHHRLDVRFGAEVTRIVPSAGHRWVATTSGGDVRCDDIVVATGHEHLPWTPGWPGLDDFAVPVAHTSSRRSVAGLAGQRVLLVGAGNSGIEFAEQLVRAGVAGLWLSMRTPPTLMPLQVAGVPLQPVAVSLARLPEKWRDAVARRISRLALGDLAPFGLPAPAQGPYERLRTSGVTAAVDRGFAAHLKAGRLTIVPEIDRLDGTRVVLRDGRVLRPDIVLAATGYRPGLEAMVGHLGVLDTDGLPTAAAAPGLWFVGYRPSLNGNLRLHPAEARRVADTITRSRPTARRTSPRRVPFPRRFADCRCGGG